MEWIDLRDHYRRLFRASRRTQADVARAGGLSQGVISKLDGLGLSLSEFFSQVEAERERSRGDASSSTPEARPPSSFET